MSQQEPDLGLVGMTIRDLLPMVNEGFRWDLITEQYDEDPVGTAMSLHFTDEDGDDAIEEIFLGIAPGPKLVVLPAINEEWDYLGAIVTYQDFGMRMLDPDDDMTPDRARYQHGGITIRAAEGESRERVWMVTSNVLDTMLESLIYQRNQKNGEVDRE